MLSWVDYFQGWNYEKDLISYLEHEILMLSWSFEMWVNQKEEGKKKVLETRPWCDLGEDRVLLSFNDDFMLFGWSFGQWALA